MEGARPKLVYVIRNGFYPPFNGERVKTAALASALAAAGDLHVLDLGRADYPGTGYPDDELLQLPYGGQARFYSLILHGHAGNLRRLRQAPGTRLSRLPLARRREAGRLIDQLNPDAVIVDHPFLAPLARQAARARTVVHAHNVESALAGSLARQSGRWRHRLKAWRLRRVERHHLPLVDQVWAVSDADATAFRALGARAVHLVPNIIPRAAFADRAVTGRHGHAAFFGWIAYPPNLDAVKYLLDMAERVPALRQLTLVGRGLPDALQERVRGNPRVRYAGYVENLAAAVDEAAVILVPLAHGGGTKLKVIEAMAMGKPLVTTPVGAEGLALEDGVHALVAQPGPDFDRAAARVLEDPAAFAAMSERGQQHCAEHFSQGALNRAVAGALAGLLGAVQAR
jgi:polysaccharide biosynthesis protein PslH